MVRLSVKDERVFADLRDRLQDVHRCVTPLTERVVPLDVTLRQIQERLAHYDPTVRVVVVGHRGSGKSMLINAITGLNLLPPNTTRELQVCPFDGPPMLRKVAGKAIASGEDGVRAHLESEAVVWVDSFADRRLHTRLPLLSGPLCHAANWTLVDTPSGTTAVCPTLNSVASRIHSPAIFAGDVVIYCVDASRVGATGDTALLKELLPDHLEVPESTFRRLLGQTVFVLTHADIVTDEEEQMTRVLRQTRPALATVAAVLARFGELVRLKTGLDVDPSRVLLVSVRNALASRRMLRSNPSVADMYDYCEMMFGSSYMQTIDAVPEDELRRTVAYHAANDGARKSGAQALDRLFALIDCNTVRHLMASVAATSAECSEQLCVALTGAKPQLMLQMAEGREALHTLVSELEWTVERAQHIETFVGGLVDSLVQLVDDEHAAFFAERVDELQRVLEHRGLEWFRERQASTVVEMAAALRRLEAFTDRYSAHRQFLLDRAAKLEGARIATEAASGGGGRRSSGLFGDGVDIADDDSAGACAASPPTTNAFIDANIPGLLRQMEREKEERLGDIGLQFAHHIKDEYVVFLPVLLERIAERKAQLFERLQEVAREPIEQTCLRCGVPFSLDDCVNTYFAAPLVEANDRRINNFLRDLPGHVAAAAVEISLQQQGAVGAGGMSARSASGASSVAGGGALSSRSVAGGGGGETGGGGGGSAASNASGPYTPDPTSGFSIAEPLRYVHEAWRLALQTVRPHQLSLYNVHALSDAVGELQGAVLGYIGSFVASLEAGIADQRELIAVADQELAEAARIHKEVEPAPAVFAGLLKELDLLTSRDVEEARRMAAAEEAAATPL